MVQGEILLKKEPVKSDKANTIKAVVYYNLGGMNYFTGKGERRGYYLSVTPVTITDNSEMFTAFTGCKQLIKETSRFSQAALEKAAESAEVKALMESMIARIKAEIKAE